MVEHSPKKEIYGTCFTTFMVSIPSNMLHHQVLANSVHSFKNYMVLDTACQRTCCSTKWFDEWSKNAAKNHLRAKTMVNREPFEFGHGPPQYSHLHAYLPVGFDYTLQSICLVGTCVINATNDIPLLGSHDLLKKMKAVIDLPKQEVRFQEKWSPCSGYHMFSRRCQSKPRCVEAFHEFDRRSRSRRGIHQSPFAFK